MKRLFFVSAVLALFAVCSCQPSPEDSKPGPEVTMVTSASDTETAVTSVSLNESIAIFGANFVNVTSININTVPVDIREAYITETRIDLVVPRVIPDNPNNKLIITTSAGSVEFDLVVNLPVLKIYGFKNDFADNGAVAEVVGENFDLYMIDKENATLKFNGAVVEMIECTANMFSFTVPEGTPWPENFGKDFGYVSSGKYENTNFIKEYGNKTSYLEVSSPGLEAPVTIPFREMGISILTNDEDTWYSGWWPTGIINANDFAADPNLAGITPFFAWVGHVKLTTTAAWQYENVTFIHWWIPEAARDIEAHPEDYVVKMEILNPSTTPLARYIRIGNPQIEGNADLSEHFMMWDPATSNGGIALNTMGKWQTVSFEVKDLFWPLEAGKNTSLVLTETPAATFDDETQFKIALQREEPGDIEFYYWNIRIVKKIKL